MSGFLKFHLVYWASILHEKPLTPLEIKEPYIRGFKEQKQK